MCTVCLCFSDNAQNLALAIYQTVLLHPTKPDIVVNMQNNKQLNSSCQFVNITWLHILHIPKQVKLTLL